MANNGKLSPEFGVVSVPLVGQLVMPHDVSISAVFTCRCDPANKPLFAKAVENAVICQRCHNVYRITAVSFNLQQGPGISFSITRIGTAEPAAAQARM